jgi:chaperonin GroES
LSGAPKAATSVYRKYGWRFMARQRQASAQKSTEETLEMQLRPLQDRVLIRRVDREAKAVGGILIPDAVQEKPLQGDVVAVGPGARGKDGGLLPMNVKPGDRVLFTKWSGTEVKLGGDELMIMNEADIIGVLEHAVADKKAA